jgi:hypothetical protein
MTSMAGGVHRVQHIVHLFIMTDDFQADPLRQFEPHELAVLGVSGVTFLAEAAGVGHAHAVDVFCDESILNPVQEVGGGDEGKQVFHVQYAGFSDSKRA